MIRMTPRSVVILLIASAIGLITLIWPLLLDAPSSTRVQPPFVFLALLPVVVAVVLAELSQGGLDPRILAMVAAVAMQCPVAVLTNNGPLMAQAIPHIVPGLFPMLDRRVLCSGMLGGRKPQPAVYTRALERLGARAAATLFVDDLFVNVQGARRAGLHADTVHDARSMRRVLSRYGLPATA